MSSHGDDPSADEILRRGFGYDPTVNTPSVDKFLQKIYPRHGEDSRFDQIFPKHLKIMGCSKSGDGEPRVCVFSDVYDTTDREQILVHLCESQGYHAELIEYDYNAHEFKSGYLLPARVCKRSNGYDCIYRGKLIGVMICTVPRPKEAPEIVNVRAVRDCVLSIVKDSLNGDSYEAPDNVSTSVKTSKADDRLTQIVTSVLKGSCFCANIRNSRVSYFVWDEGTGYYSHSKTIKYLETDVRAVLDLLVAEWDLSAARNENKWLRDRAIQQGSVKSWNKRIADRVRTALRDDLFVRMAPLSVTSKPIKTI